MARLPPASYYNGRDPLPWDDEGTTPYDYLDPNDRDEYDDFANERSRRHPNLPQTNISLSHRGTLRTSYQQPRGVSPYSSQYRSQQSPRQVSPPRQAYAPEQDRAYYNHPSTRSYQDYQRGSPPMR